MEHTAISFHTGGNTSDLQIPADLRLSGFATADCTGNATFFVSEGSSEGVCYIQFFLFPDPILSLNIINVTEIA